MNVAIELEAFDRAERQRRGMKYVRQTDTHVLHGMCRFGDFHVVGITALVDSGATAHLISETVYNKFP